jgi:hypothetical protein
LKPTVARIASRSTAWPEEAKEQMAALETAAAGSDLRAAARRTTFLRNVLQRVPEFRQSFLELKAPPGEDAQPFNRLLRMESPAFKPGAGRHRNGIRRIVGDGHRRSAVELDRRHSDG